MTAAELHIGYSERLPLFDRCLKNVKQATELFLDEHHVNHLSLTGRIKTLESFIEKVQRKKYRDPFQDNEDFVGIRIVVYYPRDILTIQEIIDTEFDLQNKIDKVYELQVNEFGYRSQHAIVRIKREWLATPNYRGLENLKIEFQVRTILMHAWAEISHKLSYKSTNEIPTRDLERELSLLSASLENSDRQLQALKDGIEKYRDEIKFSATIRGEKVSEIVELNYDSLSALLDYYLPGYPSNQKRALYALDRIREKNISLKQAEELLKKVRPIVKNLNEEIFPTHELRLTQGSILTYADDIFNTYTPEPTYSELRKKVIEKYRALYNPGS